MGEKKTTLIEQLNDRTKQYQEHGMDSFGAIEKAAFDFQLTVLEDGEACRIYQTPEGMLVNCWLDSMDAQTAKGKDQLKNSTAWYTEE